MKTRIPYKVLFFILGCINLGVAVWIGVRNSLFTKWYWEMDFVVSSLLGLSCLIWAYGLKWERKEEIPVTKEIQIQNHILDIVGLFEVIGSDLKISDVSRITLERNRLTFFLVDGDKLIFRLDQLKELPGVMAGNNT